MNCAKYCTIVFNWFNVVIKREYNHLIDVVVVASESERMSKSSEITVITGGAKGTDAWATRWAWQCGMRVICILPYNHPITLMNGKEWRLCGGHDPKLVHASAVSHPGDLSLDVPRINMIRCNSSDTKQTRPVELPINGYIVHIHHHLVKSTGYCGAIIGL